MTWGQTEAKVREPHILLGLGQDERAIGPMFAVAIESLVSSKDLKVISEVGCIAEVLHELGGRRSVIVVGETTAPGPADCLVRFEWNPDGSDSLSAPPRLDKAWGEGFLEALAAVDLFRPRPRVIFLGIRRPSEAREKGGAGDLCSVFPALVSQCVQALRREVDIRTSNWTCGIPRVGPWSLLIDPPMEVYPR